MVSFHEKRRRLVAASICENRAPGDLCFFNGMWFQDAYNYDFATIYNSNTPVATWQGRSVFVLQWWWLAEGTRERPSYGDRCRLVRNHVGTKSMRQARRYG